MPAAQGFQESQLGQSRHSHRDAVGVMQLLLSTAADKAVGIKRIESDAALNIQAGATCLLHLVLSYITHPELTERDRTLFAFAAYNAGPGNLRKFRRVAASKGLAPNLWFDNVEHAASQIVGRETGHRERGVSDALNRPGFPGGSLAERATMAGSLSMA